MSAGLATVETPRRGDVARTRRVSRGSWLLIAVVVGGAGLRLWGLGADRLNFDEAFNAMAGRRSLGDLFSYLRVRDSHPPLDYLLHAPLARAAVDEFVFRLPSALFSIAALALFAWWMRRRGVAGLVATALMALSAFQLFYGREARMYAEMELIGVAAAVLAEAWLRRPRRWHAPAAGALVFVGLMTHVSMFLLGAGLLVLAGRRADREAWRWRVALAAGLAGWAVLWGPTFLTQTGGGHSNWIPRTTLAGMVHTYARLVTYQSALALAAVVAVAAGAILLVREDRRLGRVWISCVLVPALLAAATGTVAPVLLDRTLTVVSWGPYLAIGVLAGELVRRRPTLGGIACCALVVAMVPAAVNTVTGTSAPDRVLRHVESVVAPGDVVALHPSGRLHEVEWSVAVRQHLPYRAVAVNGLGRTAGIALGPTGTSSGRLWLLDWIRPHLAVPALPRCAPDWSGSGARLSCLVTGPRGPAARATSPSQIATAIGGVAGSPATRLGGR
jgi:hypothetical protein